MAQPSSYSAQRRSYSASARKLQCWDAMLKLIQLHDTWGGVVPADGRRPAWCILQRRSQTHVCLRCPAADSVYATLPYPILTAQARAFIVFTARPSSS